MDFENILTPEQRLRLRCCEIAAGSSTYYTPDLADALYRFVKEGSPAAESQKVETA